MDKILFVDDNLQYVSDFAQRHRVAFDVHGINASKLLKGQHQVSFDSYDAILVDLLMPEIDGLSLWKDLRENSKDVPLGFLISVNYEPKYREMAFKLGMEDYLHKEMSDEEIYLRIRNRIQSRREAKSGHGSPRQFKNMEFSPNDFTCTIEGERIGLTKTEFRILQEVLCSPGGRIHRAELMEKVWSNRSVVKQTLNTHVFNINGKLILWQDQLIVDKSEFVCTKPRTQKTHYMS
ncbi:MAG TPA: hypothetical protein DCL41_09025 [Bdellovibrionales bacterium]|nr:hypothetical protein [Bdellovibrionales bacterium]